MDTKLIIYVDVDDTLIRSFGSKRIPINKTIEHVKALHERGAKIYCWSSGGANYAREIVREIGIENYFMAFLPKPNIMIDDQKVSEWRGLVYVHPGGISSRNFEEYNNKIDNEFLIE